MKRFAFIFCIFFFRESLGEEREPKFFFGPKVQTVYAYRRVPEFVTEFVPSSCIVVEPTLPACRHVRNLEIYPSVPTRIAKTQTPGSQPVEQNWKPQPSETVHHAPTPPLRVRPQQVKYTAPAWNWGLFNIFRVQNFTYTSTKTEYITTRVEDPNTVVSFHVKGCRPSKLPFNLPECAKPEGEKPKNIILMAPLKFVPEAGITPSKSENVIKIEEEIPVEEEKEEQVEEAEKSEPEVEEEPKKDTNEE